MPPLILLLRYCRPSLRLPNGCLSPMAFQPVPRSGVTPAVAAAGGGAAGCLLLPSQELPITFSLLWEQQVDLGECCTEASPAVQCTAAACTRYVRTLRGSFPPPASLPTPTPPALPACRRQRRT